jgi:hypothetical protein
MCRIIGFAILLAFVFGIDLMVIPDRKLDREFGVQRRFLGTALFVSSWVAARKHPNAWSLMGCGTAYYGELGSPEGTVHTKWFCFLFVPLLPIQSFYLRYSTSHIEVEPEHVVYTRTLTLRQTPYPGLGFYWPSIGRTALWIVPDILVVFAVLSFLKWINESSHDTYEISIGFLAAIMCVSAVIGVILGLACRGRSTVTVLCSVLASLLLFVILKWGFGAAEGWSWQDPTLFGPFAILVAVPLIGTALLTRTLAE